MHPQPEIPRGESEPVGHDVPVWLWIGGPVAFLAAVVLFLAALAGCAPEPPRGPAATTATPTTAQACGPAQGYLAHGRPDPCLTPGLARTIDPARICQPGAATRARAELTRSQWTARRRAVLAAYGLTANPGEIDHLLPLEGGGANGPASDPTVNLWPEGRAVFPAKDKAEHALHAAICRPGVTSADVRRLQAAFLARWGGGERP